MNTYGKARILKKYWKTEDLEREKKLRILNKGVCKTKDFERKMWKPNDSERKQNGEPRIFQKHWMTNDFERKQNGKPMFLKEKNMENQGF